MASEPGITIFVIDLEDGTTTSFMTLDLLLVHYRVLIFLY